MTVKKMVTGHIRDALHRVFHGKGHVLFALQKGFLSVLPVKTGNDIDRRKTAAELCNDLRQKVNGGTNRQRYADAFGIFGTEILPLLNGLLQLSVKRAQGADKLCTCRCEHSPFAGAFKEGKTNLVFHNLYLIGQCGL